MPTILAMLSLAATLFLTAILAHAHSAVRFEGPLRAILIRDRLHKDGPAAMVCLAILVHSALWFGGFVV